MATTAQQRLQEEIAFRELRKAANGGDYRALFQGKALKLKFASAKESAEGIGGALKEVVEKVDIALPNMPSIHLPPLPDIHIPEIDLGIMERIRQIARMLSEIASVVRTNIAALLKGLRDAFMELVGVFKALKEALESAFGAIMLALRLTIEGVIDLLLSLLPDVFMNFIAGIVAAILPFVGQIVAVGTMLKNIGKSIKAQVEKNRLVDAALQLAENNFTSSAWTVCISTINKELAKTHAETAIASGHCVVSLTGLVFTGNIAGAVSGILSGVAKLGILVAKLLMEIKMIKTGNEALNDLKSNPLKLNPGMMFNAAPFLGAYYLSYASTSNIASFNEVGGVKGFFGMGGGDTDGNQAKMTGTIKKLSPLVAKCRTLVKESRLELVTSGTELDYSQDLKTEIKDQFESAAKDKAFDVAKSKFS